MKSTEGELRSHSGNRWRLISNPQVQPTGLRSWSSLPAGMRVPERLQLPPRTKGKPRSVAGAGQSGPQASGHAPYLWTRKTQVLLPASGSLKPPSQIRVSLGTSLRHPLPDPRSCPRRSFARAHREPGREREMAPAARWRCRPDRARAGAARRAGGLACSCRRTIIGKNWGGRCGEISCLIPSAGPRGRARR